MTAITLLVNGRRRDLNVAPNAFLLDVLRGDLGLTGAKECCLEGECGACTVMIDGKSMNSCLILAAEVDGSEIVTVEGLAGEELSGLQTAFLANGAAQCGFCIPGQLMAAKALLDRTSSPTPAKVREALAGNLCRCGCYEQITKAVLAAARMPA
jgi:carbon-monoxide dehydrogenase small subunit